MARGKSVASLSVRLLARTSRFQAGLNKAIIALRKYTGATTKATSFTRSLGRMFSKLGSSVAAYAGAQGVFRVVTAHEKFNQAMTQSLAIMGDVEEFMRVDMRRAALEMSKTSIFSTEELGRAYFFLASAGLSAKQSLASLPAVTRFAQAGMFNLSTATELLTDAQSALGLSVDNAAQSTKNMIRISDVLTKANATANATVQEFSQALTTRTGAQLKVLGKSVEEGVAALAAFADQGIKGRDAGTQFSIVLRDLTTKAIRNKQAFKDAGVAVFDASGEMRNIADIVEDLEVALGGLSDIGAKGLLLDLDFADRSIAATQAIIGLSGAIRDYQKQYEEAGGITKSISDKILTPFQKGWAKAKGEFMDLTSVLAGAGKGMTFLGSAMEFVSKSLKTIGTDLNILKDGTITNLSPEEYARQQEGEKKLAKILEEQAVAQKKIADRNESRRLHKANLEGDAIAMAKFRVEAERLEKALGDLALSENDKMFRKLWKDFEESGFAEADVYVAAKKALTERIAIENEMGKVMEEQKNRRKDMNHELDKGRRIFEATRSPAEKFVEAMKQLNMLFSKNMLPGGLETFNREVKRLKEELNTTKALQAPGRALQITSRTFVPGFGSDGRGGTQRVQDPQLRVVIQELVRQTQAIERQNSNGGAAVTVP